MTDRPWEPAHDPAPGHDADPAPDRDEAAVRRLLREARCDDPMPTDVAARLEGTLAGLRTADASGSPGTAGAPASSAPVAGDRRDPMPTGGVRVGDLTTRRRRARSLLVAAAAAVVLGVGVGVVRNGVPDAGDGTTSGSADSASGGSVSTSPGRDPLSAGRGGSASTYLPPALGRPTSLSAQRFGQQVRRLAPHGRVAARPVPDGSTCVPGGFRDAALVPVRYAHAAGLLVYRRPMGESRVVDLYVCGQQDPVRSLTLPTR